MPRHTPDASPGTQDLVVTTNLKVLPVLPGLGSLFPISNTDVTLTWADLETSTPTATSRRGWGPGARMWGDKVRRARRTVTTRWTRLT